MNILGKINHRRMKIMRGMAGNIGVARQSPIERAKVKRILITRPNGRLGNLLLITPLLQEIEAIFPDAKIDLFVKGGMASSLFRNYHNIERIIQLPNKPFNNLLKYAWAWLCLKKHRYDLVVNAVNYSSSGRLSTKFATSRHKFFGDIDETVQSKYIDYRHIAKAPVYNLRHYLNALDLSERRQIAPLNLKLTKDELSAGQSMLSTLTWSNKKTICLFTYATGRKCYPAEWWLPFYERLKSEYPDYNIIEVLPIENVSQIGFKAPVFYSSDVRKIAALIANTSVFIGADSGIMHLACAAGAPVIGLFRASNSSVYRPYNCYSTAIDTNIMDDDSIIASMNAILYTQASPVLMANCN